MNNTTLATAKRQIQPAENRTPAVVISVRAARVDNAIHLDYLTSEVALEEPEISSTDSTILKENNDTNDKLPFGMPGGSGYFEDECGACDAIPTSSQRQRAATELERIDQGSSDVDWYEGDDGDDVDAELEEEAS
jgi:hypothetical protein